MARYEVSPNKGCPGLKSLVEGADNLPGKIYVHLNGVECQVLGSYGAAASEMMVSCNCKVCLASQTPRELFRDGGRVMSLHDWCSHCSAASASLDAMMVRQPGTNYQVPFMNWLRTASLLMGGETLKRKQLSIFWWNAVPEAPVSTVPRLPSQPPPDPSPASGAWRAATVVGFDAVSGLFALKYHSDPKKQFCHIYLPIALMHFARTGPPADTPPRNVAEWTSPLPPVLLPPYPPRASAAALSLPIAAPAVLPRAPTVDAPNNALAPSLSLDLDMHLSSLTQTVQDGIPTHPVLLQELQSHQEKLLQLQLQLQLQAQQLQQQAALQRVTQQQQQQRQQQLLFLQKQQQKQHQKHQVLQQLLQQLQQQDQMEQLQLQSQHPPLLVASLCQKLSGVLEQDVNLGGLARNYSTVSWGPSDSADSSPMQPWAVQDSSPVGKATSSASTCMQLGDPSLQLSNHGSAPAHGSAASLAAAAVGAAVDNSGGVVAGGGLMSAGRLPLPHAAAGGALAGLGKAPGSEGAAGPGSVLPQCLPPQGPAAFQQPFLQRPSVQAVLEGGVGSWGPQHGWDRRSPVAPAPPVGSGAYPLPVMPSLSPASSLSPAAPVSSSTSQKQLRLQLQQFYLRQQHEKQKLQFLQQQQQQEGQRLELGGGMSGFAWSPAGQPAPGNFVQLESPLGAAAGDCADVSTRVQQALATTLPVKAAQEGCKSESMPTALEASSWSPFSHVSQALSVPLPATSLGDQVLISSEPKSRTETDRRLPHDPAAYAAPHPTSHPAAFGSEASKDQAMASAHSVGLEAFYLDTAGPQQGAASGSKPGARRMFNHPVTDSPAKRARVEAATTEAGPASESAVRSWQAVAAWDDIDTFVLESPGADQGGAQDGPGGRFEVGSGLVDWHSLLRNANLLQSEGRA